MGEAAANQVGAFATAYVRGDFAVLKSCGSRLKLCRTDRLVVKWRAAGKMEHERYPVDAFCDSEASGFLSVLVGELWHGVVQTVTIAIVVRPANTEEKSSSSS